MNNDFLLKLTKAQLINIINEKDKRIQELESDSLDNDSRR